jgi:hypothetical protein
MRFRRLAVLCSLLTVTSAGPELAAQTALLVSAVAGRKPCVTVTVEMSR